MWRYLNPFMDWLYGIALALAILKDILDFTGLGSLPLIGTVITLMVSLFIFMVMFLTGSGAKRKMARYSILMGGTLVEFIFGIDFLPIETLIVILVFRITLQERQRAAIEKSALQTQESIA